MKNSRIIDIFDLGKNTFNSCYPQLKNDKKILKLYSQYIEQYLDSIEDNKNVLTNIIRDIDKNSSVDKPFSFIKKFEIIINLQFHYVHYFLENSQKSFDYLKESIDNNLKIISDFLTNTINSANNIKIKSNIFFEKYDKVIKSLEEIENKIIDCHIKNIYKIQINTEENKKNEIEDLVKETKNCEKEYLNSKNNMKDIFQKFLTEYNSNMKEIKEKMTKLNNDCKIEQMNIIKIIKENCSNLISLLDNGIKKLENYDNNNEKFIKGYSEYLNNEIEKEELFEALNNEKYKMKIINEKDRNSLENKINKNNNKSNQISIDSEDIYKIVEKIYSYKFEAINKNDYDLIIEKNKLKILKKTSAILGYNFKIRGTTKKEVMSEKESDDFISFIFSKEDYILEFLILLNNFRTAGKYEFSLDIFNIVKIIFDKAADYLITNKNKKIADYLIILSQTFYLLKENKKYFLQKELLKKEYFRSIDFWFNKLDFIINEELERFEKELVKKDISLSEQKKVKKMEEILYTKFLSFATSLNGFEIEKEKIDQIIVPLFNKYNIKKDMQKSIISLLDVYKNNNNNN